MDKSNELEYTYLKDYDSGFGHGVNLVERKNLIISGVKKINSFDSEEFLVETTLGILNIKGQNLEIVKLDTYQGNLSIKGVINCVNYLDDDNLKNKDDSFWGKLFK